MSQVNNLPSYFLWPQAKPLSITDLIGSEVTSKNIETRLAELYPDAHPVLFSSARAGLRAALAVMKLGRAQLLWTPGYSSHCVLEAAAHICTPSPVASSELSAALVYHQWGYIQKANFGDAVTIIEDSVDSLLIPGFSPFSESGTYALWSLPKVFGTLGGGVVFCRFPEGATALRALRNQCSSSLLQAFLRHYAKSSSRASAYWNGAEALQGELPAPLRRQVSRALENIDALIQDRLNLLKFISPSIAETFQKSGRLPSNLPLHPPRCHSQLWNSSGPFTSELRRFNASRNYPDSRWELVAPLPVHVDVSKSDLVNLLKPLNMDDFFNELKIL